jgi:hypothetical protein
MAKIYGFKSSDGEPKGVAVNDDGELIVNTDSSALPTGAATEQGLDDILAKLSADPATQTTLAAVLAKIIAAPSTEAKQDLIIAEVTPKVLLYAPIDFSSASAQTIIAAPGAGNRIRLTRLSLMSGGTPQVNVEIALKSGASLIETMKGAAMVSDYHEHRNLGTNEAFVVQCTSADRVIGGADYYVEAV